MAHITCWTTTNHQRVEGAFESAEVHFLASGKRDSARLLADMFIEWATPSNVYGVFALRGTIPYAINVTFNTILIRPQVPAERKHPCC